MWDTVGYCGILWGVPKVPSLQIYYCNACNLCYTRTMGLVLGIDPGFASVGYALMTVRPTDEQLVQVGVIATKKTATKHAMYASDDNFRRGREIYRTLTGLLTDWGRVKAICAESMSFPRNASAAAKVAICWGILASLSEAHCIPFVQVSPQTVKKCLCGVVTASKTDVLHAVRKRYPTFDKLATTCATQLEHPTDAVATIVAALDSDILRLIRRS